MSHDFAGVDVDADCKGTRNESICSIHLPQQKPDTNNCEIDEFQPPYVITVRNVEKYSCNVFVTLDKTSHCFKSGYPQRITQKAKLEGW